MTWRLAVLLVVAVIAASVYGAPAQRSQPAEPGELGTITIHLIDQFGRAVEGRIDSFSSRQGEMISHFVGMRGTRIPYGTYTYVIRQGGPGSMGEDLTGRITVERPEALFTIAVLRKVIPGLTMDTGIPPGFLMQGKLARMPVQKVSDLVWVRLSPIHGTRQLDVAVDPSGYFRIYEPLQGHYVLSVICGEEVLHVQEVSFEENGRPAVFVVELPTEAKQGARVLHVRAGGTH